MQRFKWGCKGQPIVKHSRRRTSWGDRHAACGHIIKLVKGCAVLARDRKIGKCEEHKGQEQAQGKEKKKKRKKRKKLYRKDESLMPKGLGSGARTNWFEFSLFNMPAMSHEAGYLTSLCFCFSSKKWR